MKREKDARAILREQLDKLDMNNEEDKKLRDKLISDYIWKCYEESMKIIRKHPNRIQIGPGAFNIVTEN